VARANHFTILDKLRRRAGQLTSLVRGLIE
jgi:hypothetical protein